MTVSGLQLASIDQIAGENGTVIFKSVGDWTINSLKGVVKPLDEYVRAIAKTPIKWDVSGVQKIDSAGIALLVHYYDFLHSQGCSIEITGQKPEFQELYELLRPMVSGQQEEKRSFFSRWLSPLINLGESVTNFWHDIISFLYFV